MKGYQKRITRNLKTTRKYSLLSVLLFMFCCKQEKDSKAIVTKDEKPNIILIMADDMGFSDIGCYGSEIQTPNIDALAKNGLRFTQFYNAGRCCPTRAALLTGQYQHEVGMGWMTSANLGEPGYKGDLSPDYPTVAELLKTQGYETYMSGKWHLTSTQKLDGENSIKDSWPTQRGFDNFFGTLEGGGSYFDPEYLARNNELIKADTDFYYTDAISDNATNFITDHYKRNEENPFFLYVAYTAPHFPLHAKSEEIAKYLSYYEKGWDSVQKERHSKMEHLGIHIPTLEQTTNSVQKISEWEPLNNEEKKNLIKRMAIYAAQIDIMDQGIGEIVDTLKNQDQLENTLILFLSDNGATKENISRKDKSYEALGTEHSYESYGMPWAHLGNTPFREYKKYMQEGGIATPLIVHWPKKIKSNSIANEQIGHVMDLTPTLLEVAEGSYSKDFFEGKSLLPSFMGTNFSREPLFWEHEGNRAVRVANWKLVAYAGEGPTYEGIWELYDLSKDRGELDDMAKRHPERVAELSALWNQWAKSHKVFPLDGRGWNARIVKK